MFPARSMLEEMKMGILKDGIAGDVGSAPRCQTCGSEHVVREAWACWNRATGLWELEAVHDRAFCHACEDSTVLIWSRKDVPPNQRIRELNDQFRQTGQGRDSIMITEGVQAKGSAFTLAAVNAVRSFDAFSDENDPWGEHDFGAIELEGEKIFFKIDYYDLSLQHGSENPANESCTHRVLTILLASEY